MTRLTDEEYAQLKAISPAIADEIRARKPYARIIGDIRDHRQTLPEHSWDYRLATLSALDEVDFFSLFERHVLLEDRQWDMDQAMPKTIFHCDGTPLVLLGPRVAMAFNHGYAPYQWGLLDDRCTWAVQILHPSEMELLSPETREKIRETLWRAIRIGLGSLDVYSPSCGACGMRPETHRAHPTRVNRWVMCPGAEPRVLAGSSFVP